MFQTQSADDKSKAASQFQAQRHAHYIFTFHCIKTDKSIFRWDRSPLPPPPPPPPPPDYIFDRDQILSYSYRCVSCHWHSQPTTFKNKKNKKIKWHHCTHSNILKGICNVVLFTDHNKIVASFHVISTKRKPINKLVGKFINIYSQEKM